MSIDEKWMREALDLARKGEGMTRPNPPVGAVIVKDGRKIGEGYHRRSGGLHAEVSAIRNASAPVKGADIYVTLEPCSTMGRTPPCTDAIIESGIKRAIVSVEDPNPHHAGRGLDILRRAGVEVDFGLCNQEAMKIKEPFAKWILTGRPWLTLKLATTLDGRIADRHGHSRWITGPDSRATVQHLRRSADAIMVGSGTARADDPSLMPRPALGRKPYRIVLSSKGDLSLGLKLFTDGRQEQTIVATTEAATPAWIEKLEKKGVTVWKLPAKAGRVSLKSLLKRLGDMGMLHVVCEGGGGLAREIAGQNLADEFIFFKAPSILGADARPAIDGLGWTLPHCIRLNLVENRVCGNDIMIRARPIK